MSRRPLHAALSLALACATWASPTFAQSPVAAPAQNQAVQTLTVAEPGRPPEKCALLQVWQLDDGSPAMKVKSLATGEIMTVVEPVQSTAAKDRFRVYRWGKSVVPPPGSPAPPQEEEPAARKWPSAHETVKTATPLKTRSASTARAAPRTQPSTPIVAPRPLSGSTESQPKVQSVPAALESASVPKKESQTVAQAPTKAASAAGRPSLAKPDATAQVKKEEPRTQPPLVAAPAPPEPWTASVPDSNRKSEATKGESRPPESKGETPASLAAAVAAPPTPVSPAMDRNPAVPSSMPVAPAAPAATSPTKAQEPASSPPVATSTPSRPAERTGPAEERAVKKTENSAIVEKTQRVVQEKPSERPSAPAAPEEPGIVSRSRPAVSLLPSEPPTPILQVAAPAASTASTSRPISRPTLPSVAKQSANVAKHDQGAALDYGQVVSRTAPALPANAGQVMPRRTGPDPLANPDQYVRLNKRDREERTPLPAPSTLPSSALQVERSAKPQAATTAKANEKQAPSDARVARAEPVAKPAVEPKREVVQVSAKDTKPPAQKLERPAPTTPVAAMTAPPPPSLERVEKKEAAQPARRSAPVVKSEIRQVALLAPSQAQMLKPMPSTDVSTLLGMVDRIKVLSDSGVAAYRQKAATELGAVDATSHPYVVAALTSAAKRDETAQVRVAAIHSLKQMRSDSPTVREAFEAGIGDADPRVRDAAAEALRTIPAKRPTIQPVTGFSP